MCQLICRSEKHYFIHYINHIFSVSLYLFFKINDMRKYLTLILIFIAGLSVTASAQKRNQAYEDYIRKYRGIAVDEMKKYHIPASITLAQGLLESGAGRSTLARKSNNPSVSVLTGMPRNRMKTIRNSCEQEPDMLSFSD